MIFCNENWIKYNPNLYPCPKTKRGVIFFLIGINTSDIYDCLVGWRMVLSSLLVGFFSDEDEKTKWNEKIRDFTTEFFYTVKKNDMFKSPPSSIFIIIIIIKKKIDLSEFQSLFFFCKLKLPLSIKANGLIV